MPGGLPRFNSDRGRPRIIRQRSAAPAPRSGSTRTSSGLIGPIAGFVGSTMAPTEGSVDGGRLRRGASVSSGSNTSSGHDGPCGDSPGFRTCSRASRRASQALPRATRPRGRPPSQFLDAPLLAQEGVSAGIDRVLGAMGVSVPVRRRIWADRPPGSCGSPRAHPSPASSGPSG